MNTAMDTTANVPTSSMNIIYGHAWYWKQDLAKDAAMSLAVAPEVHLRYEAYQKKYLQAFFADWATAYNYMRHFTTPESRTFCEVLRDGFPCKPYLDIDVDKDASWPSYFPQNGGPRGVAAFLSPIIQHVFEEDFGVHLHDSSLIWTHSEGTSKKLSIHLVICTRSPQVVFRSNLKTPHGAAHLAERLRSILKVAHEDGTIDMSVYSRNRGMRMLNCTKRDKAGIMAPLFDDTPAFEASAISWLDPPHMRKVLEVPAKYLNHVPSHFKKNRKGFAKISEAQADRRKAVVRETGIVAKLLEEVQKHFHPTAFLCGAWASEDPWGTGIRMNYTDRAEPCYSGKIHTANNFAVRILPDNTVVARCFDPMCSSGGSRRKVISRLAAADLAPPLRPADTTQVDMQFIDFEECPAISQEGLWDLGKRHAVTHDAARGCYVVTDKIRNAIDRWTDGRFKALCIKSAMGTGKSCFMVKLLELFFRKKPDFKVLVITYRQALAQELGRKLMNFDFQNYLHCPGMDLREQHQFPRLILQLDSLPRIEGTSFMPAPMYDLVILDEFDSLLRHFESATIAEPVYLIDQLTEVLQQSRHVLCMDALFGDGCFRALDSMGISSHLIHNTFRAPPRTFEMVENKQAWLEGMINAVVAEQQRVVVPCMHLTMAMAIRDCFHEAGVDPSRICVHTSKDGKERRQLLDNVDEHWSKIDVLIFTPSVESGVDFSVPYHFHRMYVYIGMNSTSCWGLYQMTGRVRKLVNPTILCLADRPTAATEHTTAIRASFDDAAHFLTWMEAKLPKEAANDAIKLRAQRKLTSAQDDDGVVYNVKLPEADPAFVISAYLYACGMNSKSRFLLEFRSIVEEAGHIFVSASAKPKAALDDINAEMADEAVDDVLEENDKGWMINVGGGQIDMQDLKARYKEPTLLLQARDFENEEEAKAAMDRKRSNEAHDEDTPMLDRHAYKKVWGVGTLTEDFVKKHPTFDHASLDKFQDLLQNPDILPVKYDPSKMAHQKKWPFLMPMIIEVIKKLGFKGPLDDETVLEAANWTELYKTRELHTTVFFGDYNNCVDLTSERAFRGSRDLDVEDPHRVSTAINKNLLEKVGLNLQQEGRGAVKSFRLKGADECMALLFLRYNRSWERKFRQFPPVLEYSENHPEVMQRYMELAAKPESNARFWLNDGMQLVDDVSVFQRLDHGFSTGNVDFSGVVG